MAGKMNEEENLRDGEEIPSMPVITVSVAPEKCDLVDQDIIEPENTFALNSNATPVKILSSCKLENHNTSLSKAALISTYIDSELINSLSIMNLVSESSFDSHRLDETSYPSNMFNDSAFDKTTEDSNLPSSSEVRVLPAENNKSPSCAMLESIDSINISAINRNIFNDPEDLPDIAKNLDSEEFKDAVQFFKDPSSMQFLDNIECSTKQQLYKQRNSLYLKFDPLHSREVEPPTEVEQKELHSAENEVSKNVDINSPMVNKQLSNLSRESIGNYLLSFDSPVKTTPVLNSQRLRSFCKLPKLYTKEEFEQHLMNHELTIHENCLNRQKEIEMKSQKKCEEKDKHIAYLKETIGTLREAVSNIADTVSGYQQENSAIASKIKDLEAKKVSLTCEVKTSMENLQNIKSDLAHLRNCYDKSKGMLKIYKANEQLLKEHVSNLKNVTEEKGNLINDLQERMGEMVEKANSQISSVEKGDNTQVEILKAQLKRSELRASTLESDITLTKIENDKLSDICDNLMAKVRD